MIQFWRKQWFLIPFVFVLTSAAYLAGTRVVFRIAGNSISPFTSVPFAPNYRPYTEAQLRQAVLPKIIYPGAKVVSVTTSGPHCYKAGELPGFGCTRDETVNVTYIISKPTYYHSNFVENVEAPFFQHGFQQTSANPGQVLDFEKSLSIGHGSVVCYVTVTASYSWMDGEGEKVQASAIIDPVNGIVPSSENSTYYHQDVSMPPPKLSQLFW